MKNKYKRRVQMKTRSYSDLYVYDAQEILGGMFDYAVYSLKENLSEFFGKFTNTKVCELFENGNPTYVTGMSGPELAEEVHYELCNELRIPLPHSSTLYRTEEYRAGWALAFYQWYTAKTFKEINKSLPVQRVTELYYPLHEAGILRIIDSFDSFFNPSNITSLRRATPRKVREPE